MRPQIHRHNASDEDAPQGGTDEISLTLEYAQVAPGVLEHRRRGPGRARRGDPSTKERFQITADRPIFTLSVAADLLGLHPRTLRIYEEKNLVVPARTGGNRRRYSQNDIQKFQAIRQLTLGGVNLEGVRIILDMSQELTALGGDPIAVIERNLQSFDEG